MLLHIVNKSPFERDAFASCVRHLQKNASLLLIEDGVYAALAGTATDAHLKEAMRQVSVYALRPDIEARGLGNRIADGVTLIDYEGFVDLVTSHSGTHSWL